MFFSTFALCNFELARVSIHHQVGKVQVKTSSARVIEHTLTSEPSLQSHALIDSVHSSSPLREPNANSYTFLRSSLRRPLRPRASELDDLLAEGL